MIPLLSAAFVGRCEPDWALMQMPSLWASLRPHAANSRDEAKLCILKAASSLLHYWLFMIFLASRPVTSLLPQSYVRLLWIIKRLKKNHDLELGGGAGGLADVKWTFDTLTERALSPCLPCNLIMPHNGTSYELGGEHGWKQMGWKCFTGGPPKKLT